MYEVKLTDKALEMTSNPNDLIHIPMWIVQIYDMETALICSLIDREWIEKVMSWECEGSNWIKKSKEERAYISLLECWIIKIEWEKFVFDQDRLAEMNHLWCKVEEEKNKEYIWIWDYETVEKYEEMTRFLKKYLRLNKTK
jgi:hypothetical protein